MIFSWDAVTAISTAVTAVVIAATVVVGYRQIRLTGDQLQHLRRSTQLDGTMKLFAELSTPEFRAARLFVENELAARMQDPRASARRRCFRTSDSTRASTKRSSSR